MGSVYDITSPSAFRPVLPRCTLRIGPLETLVRPHNKLYMLDAKGPFYLPFNANYV